MIIMSGTAGRDSLRPLPRHPLLQAVLDFHLAHLSRVGREVLEVQVLQGGQEVRAQLVRI